MNRAIVVPTAIAGLATIGFGVWHLFVPKAWNWYAYIDPAATELVIAVRAINVFFSASLILFGLMSWAMVAGERSNRYSRCIVIGAATLLWLLRVAMQLAHPQGSMDARLQAGMLLAFIAIFLCYAIPLCLVLAGKAG